ncbi:MAG: hypothetical protein H6672_16215 [Anaerolineaceae bacterium]|nr:hypothetical protein [Anaerolineaceae bacterium]
MTNMTQKKTQKRLNYATQGVLFGFLIGAVLALIITPLLQLDPALGFVLGPGMGVALGFLFGSALDGPKRSR